MKKQPIINCHTHIFTADSIPPYLAKTFIPFGLYILFPVGLFVSIARWWFGSNYSPYKWRFQRWYKVFKRNFYQININFTRLWILKIAKWIVGIIIIFSIFNSLNADYLSPWLLEKNINTIWLKKIDNWLVQKGILIITESIFLKTVLLIIFLLFFPSGRNFLWFLLRKFSTLFKMLPGKNTIELIKRYINIVRYARYKYEKDIFTKLTGQYPEGTSMIVLPMDMEFMGAGRSPKSYGDQMKELDTLKQSPRGDQIYPFVFVDPRRKLVGEQKFFEYHIQNGQVILDNECFIKDYIENKRFSGFKIYPALGYFPFEEALLPLWKYAADNCIPIMTHCIRGTIFYRGSKKKEWDYHPVFKQSMSTIRDDGSSDEMYEPLLLPQMNAVDVQEIFTHPLNYTCLLKKELLVELVAASKDPRIKELFGFNEIEKTISRDLGHLKICFAHFGGEDEWQKFFEKDRDNYANQLIRNPNKGIDFFYTNKVLKKGKLEQIWRSGDWYSIICSLMLQHPNVYADLSYILHDDSLIMPLLRHTLQHGILKKRILYGTDFYVVRNHKSDKNMLVNIQGGLTEDEFEQIACKNPIEYLKHCD
ncbi:amidohydrolase family protein [Cognataquiflexum aquatile]|uniref:amidohydrolase family protein n=1 Tax=Cognataquiflexum aquatile TaxID=2249427 RepID=UPI000DEAB89E|nr:amidohydrolase family protein [Cognataquiflexum aquatile]